MIYLISGENGFVKIGRAADVTTRMRDLQCSNPHRLRLLRTWPGGSAEESALHRAFAAYRVRGNGEWFRFTEAMLTADPAKILLDLIAEVAEAAEIPVDRAVIVEAARDAIERAGGGTALARVLGVTKGAVQQWKDVGIPPTRCSQVSKLTGLTPQHLRPDVFGFPPMPPSPAAGARAATPPLDAA